VHDGGTASITRSASSSHAALARGSVSSAPTPSPNPSMNTAASAPRASTLYSAEQRLHPLRARSFIVRRAHTLCDVGPYELPFGKGKQFNIGNPRAQRGGRRWQGRWDRYDADRRPRHPVRLQLRQCSYFGRRLRPETKFFRRQHLRRQPDAFALAEPARSRSTRRIFLASVAATPSRAPAFSPSTWKSQTVPMPYKESHSLRCGWEAFNVLNHPNWGRPSLNILSGRRSLANRH